MKKIFTLALAAILFSVTTFAADRPNSNIVIRSNSNSFIQVVVDGHRYNMNNNGFTSDFIRPGRHSIQVYRIDNYGMFRKRPQMIYSNTMDLRPWESINVNIDRFARVFVDSRTNRDNNYNGRGHDRDYNHGPVYGDRDHDGYRH